ncbi:unnamed protein product [Ixodes pacificus]
MAAKDDSLNHLGERLDLMNQLVSLSNLTVDDHYMLQECHQRLRNVDNLQAELHSLIGVYEEQRREMSALPPKIEQLQSLASYVNVALVKAVEAKKSRVPLPTPKHGQAVPFAEAANTGVAYITNEEFEHVPKYMKGRQTVKALNLCVDVFNKAVAAKYELLARPKAQLREAQWAKVNAFRSQESNETKGVKFVVEGDIRSKGGLLDTAKAVNNFVVIMRHCGRLREIRGQGFVRFAVM